MSHDAPGELELAVSFRKHLGGHFAAASLRIQFHHNQTPGIHFKVAVPTEFQDAIRAGLRDGVAVRFPNFPANASIWVLDVEVDPVDSSWRAFYCAARLIIDQASALREYNL